MFLSYFGIKHAYIWELLFLSDNCVNILEHFHCFKCGFLFQFFFSKIKNTLSQMKITL